MTTSPPTGRPPPPLIALLERLRDAPISVPPAFRTHVLETLDRLEAFTPTPRT